MQFSAQLILQSVNFWIDLKGGEWVETYPVKFLAQKQIIITNVL